MASSPGWTICKSSDPTTMTSRGRAHQGIIKCQAPYHTRYLCHPLASPPSHMSQHPPLSPSSQLIGSQPLSQSATAANRGDPSQGTTGLAKTRTDAARAACSPPCADDPPQDPASAHPNHYLFDPSPSEFLSQCFWSPPGRDPESDRRVVAHPPAECACACSAGRADGEYNTTPPEELHSPQQNSPSLYTMPDPGAYDNRYAPPLSRSRSRASSEQSPGV